jgi:hypothetical protein
MPLQVRVDGRDVELPMADGRGHVDLPPHALYTVDPHSRVLRAMPHIDAYQVDVAARLKAAAEAAQQADPGHEERDHGARP